MNRFILLCLGLFYPALGVISLYADDAPSGEQLHPILVTALKPWINIHVKANLDYHYYEVDGKKPFTSQTFSTMIWDQDLQKNIFKRRLIFYTDASRTNVGKILDEYWNAKKFISIDYPVSEQLGFRLFPSGEPENPGYAVVDSRPFIGWNELSYLWIDPLTNLPIYQELLDDIKNLSTGYGIDSSGGKSITVSSPYYTLYIDKHSYALKEMVQYAFATPSERYPFRRYVVTKSDANGFPLSLSEDTYLGKDKLASHTQIDIDPASIQLNNVTQSLTELELPTGCFVTDQIQKKTYKITGLESGETSPDEISRRLDDLVKKAQSQASGLER
jgi:hypothetical protein